MQKGIQAFVINSEGNARYGRDLLATFDQPELEQDKIFQRHATVGGRRRGELRGKVEMLVGILELWHARPDIAIDELAKVGQPVNQVRAGAVERLPCEAAQVLLVAVSYTHLTLPTTLCRS